MLARIAEGVRSGAVRPRDLVVRAVRRIEALDGRLNAVVALRAEEALAEADALEAELARSGRGPGAGGPLCGLPVLVKDIEDVAGMRTTHGSLAFADAPPATVDGLAPARLRAAGAIIIGKTNTPELAWAGWTANRLFGVTRNPWGAEWTPGGSSGGSAAALAAGLVPIATATDGGGSIRIPASFCGLLGLKPSAGLVPRRPLPSWIDYSSDGPLAATAADLRLLLDVLRGPLAGDPSAVEGWTPALGRLPRRVMVCERHVDGGPLPAPVHELFRRAVRRVAEVLAEAAGERSPAAGGAASSRRARSSAIQVDAVPQGALFPACDPAAEWSAVCGPEQAHQLGERFIRKHAELFDPGFRAWMEMSLEVPMAEYQRARRRRFEHVRRFDELLDGDTVLLSPVLCFSEQHADGRLPGAGQPGVPTDLENTYAANITGHPAISLPAGRVPSGVGCGLMVTGPRLGDDMLLALAELWEAAEPWPRVASGYDEFTAGLPL